MMVPDAMGRQPTPYPHRHVGEGICATFASPGVSTRIAPRLVGQKKKKNKGEHQIPTLEDMYEKHQEASASVPFVVRIACISGIWRRRN
jgi:hypothetical protein